MALAWLQHCKTTHCNYADSNEFAARSCGNITINIITVRHIPRSRHQLKHFPRSGGGGSSSSCSIKISLLVLMISHFPRPRAFSPNVLHTACDRSPLSKAKALVPPAILLKCSAAVRLSSERSHVLIGQLCSKTCSLALAAELGPFFQSFALAFLLVFYDLSQLLCLIF